MKTSHAYVVLKTEPKAAGVYKKSLMNSLMALQNRSAEITTQINVGKFDFVKIDGLTKENIQIQQDTARLNELIDLMTEIENRLVTVELEGHI